MNIAALVEAPDHVCCRYRVRAFSAELARAGYVVEILTYGPKLAARLRSLLALNRFDAVILQRRLLPRWELALLRRRATHLIFDFDDAIFLRDSYSPKGLHSSRRWARFAATVQAADAVIAGNDWLAERARAAGAVGPVHVIPTCVDPDDYSPRNSQDDPQRLQLVWVGSSSTLRGLQAVKPMLESLGREVPGIELKLICDSFLSLDRLPVALCRWQAATEATEIAAADVGISWVPDDDWSRGKCGLKVLQYMAAGLAVIANPVGVQSAMVRTGETGFLASSPAQWVEAVRILARDADLRRALGAAGRRVVEEQYSVKTGVERWIAALDVLRANRRIAV